jgi:hypothetical protein
VVATVALERAKVDLGFDVLLLVVLGDLVCDAGLS